jgi:flagella basal body P-ring formation protein FlgA
MIRRAFFLALLGTGASAEIVVPARTIPAQHVIGPDDLTLRDMEVPGAITNPDLLIGMEARIALYAGRPIREDDVGFPATVERNQIVALVYQSGALFISAEGRALDRAGPGDLIQVMNIASRATVSARIGADGAAYVTQ